MSRKLAIVSGTKVTWQVNSGVVLQGLYVDGVRTSLRRWEWQIAKIVGHWLGGGSRKAPARCGEC